MTEMSNCEIAGAAHCHTAKAKRMASEKAVAENTKKLLIACILCLFFIAGEVKYFGNYVSC